ncbi:MAG: hypothetical protein RIA65_14010 [Woeseia sp.]
MDQIRNSELQQKRRIRNHTLLFAGIALVVYIGFITISGLR